MSSFDDLAFVSSNGRNESKYCESCREIRQVHANDNRCEVCGEQLCCRPVADRIVRGGIPIGQAAGDHLGNLIMQLIIRLEGDVEAGMGTETLRNKSASEAAISRVETFVVTQSNTREAIITTRGIDEKIVLIHASFGPGVALILSEIVMAQPDLADAPLVNQEEVKDKIVMVRRGKCSFASKVRKVQEAGGLATIILQNNSIWPYVMTHSKNESSCLTIPAYMISQGDGKRLCDYIHQMKVKGLTVEANITVREDIKECAICFGEVSEGMTAMRMPCQHYFHAECLRKWLGIRNSCPICRSEIDSKSSTVEDQARNPPSSWSEFLS